MCGEGRCAGCTWERTRLQFLAFIACVAFVFSVVSVVSCRFYAVDFAEGQQLLGGLFRVSYRHDQCLSYNDIPGDVIDVQFTAGTKAARGFGVLAILFGSVAVIVVLAMQCILTPSKRSWKIILAYSCLASFTAQSFTFLVYKQVVDTWCYRQDVDCGMGIGSILSVVACILYLLMGLSVLLLLQTPTKTAYQCDCLTKFLRGIVNRTGIQRKHDIRRSVRSMSWLQGLVLVVSIVCFLFSIAVLFDCRFFTTSFQGNEWQLGLYYYLYTPENTCRMYEYGDRISFFTSTKAAQVFGVIAFFAGMFLMVILWAMVFLNFPGPMYEVALPALAFLSAMSQGFTFFVFKEVNDRVCRSEEQSCGLGVDGILSAIATALYLAMAYALFCYGGAVETQKTRPPSISVMEGKSCQVAGGDVEGEELLSEPVPAGGEKDEEEIPVPEEDRKDM